MNSVTSPDESVYGVPWDLTIYLMYYRPDVLEEVGAPVPPKTWDEMIDAIKKLQAAGKSGFMMQWGNTQWLYYFNYLYQAGGTLYDDACEKATVNSPDGVKALEFYRDLYNVYNISTDGWPDLEGGLESGDLGFGVTGSWVAGSLDIARPEMAGKWKMGVLPAGPGGKNTAFIGGRIIGIMSFSENPDVAAEFIGSLYQDEVAEAMTTQAASINIFFIPPRIDFAEKIQAPAEWIDVLKAQLSDAVGPPNCVGWEESARTVEQQIQEVIFNNADPAAALQIAADTMEGNLE
jgi:ABC-type glycerol-3-phosphate transport system substrate-binding protein